MDLPIKKNKKNVDIMKALKKDRKLRNKFTTGMWNNLCYDCQLKARRKVKFRNNALSYDDFCNDCKKKASEVQE